MIGADAPPDMENREGLEEYAVRWNWSEGPSASGFTSVVRVKDEARSIPWVLPPLLRAVGRVVLVDNGSTDGTPEVARQAAESAGLADKLEILSYPFPVSRCGPEHLATHPESVHSLTYFYNWSFSHVATRYALKWDGDMLLTPQGEQVMRDLAWQLEGINTTIRMGRAAVYVESDRVAYVDLAYTHGELWAWPNTPKHTFIKCFDWEFVNPFEDHILQLPDTLCMELKWLDADEFAHWSSTKFEKLNMNARKRRDRDLFRAIHEGLPLPRDVVRIESPEGVNAIEYLRHNFTRLLSELRLKGETAPVPGDPASSTDEAPPAASGGASPVAPGARAPKPEPAGEVRRG